MAGEYLGLYESYLQGSKTAKDGPEIAVAFLQSMSSSRETFLPLVSDTKAIQLLQGYVDLCNAKGRFVSYNYVSGVLSVFVAATDRDPKKAVQFLVKNSKSNNSAELVRQAITWAGPEANVSQTLSSLTGGRAGLEIESLIQAKEPLQQYKQKALLTQALEYSLIFSSPEEKFGALIGRYATAGDSLLTPTEFSTMALNAAKKVGASTQLKALAKGLAADEKFKAGPGIHRLQHLCLGGSPGKRQASLDGPYIGRKAYSRCPDEDAGCGVGDLVQGAQLRQRSQEYAAVCQDPAGDISCAREGRTRRGMSRSR